MEVSLKYKLFCPHCTKGYIYNRYGVKEYLENCYSVYEVFTEKPVWLIIKNGPYGKFAGCPNFPKCSYSVSLERKHINIDYDDELRPY